MGNFSRRTLLLGSGALIGAYGARAFYSEDIPRGTAIEMPRGDQLILNDASELSPTAID